MSQLHRRLTPAQIGDLGVLEARVGHVYHWKHGWIPLDHPAAGEAGGDAGTDPGEELEDLMDSLPEGTVKHIFGIRPEGQVKDAVYKLDAMTPSQRQAALVKLRAARGR